MKIFVLLLNSFRTSDMEQLILKTQGHFEMTDDLLFQLCADNKDLKIERNSNLDIIIMAPTGLQTGGFNGEVFRQLANWNFELKMGKVYDSSTGFILPDKSLRSPDVAWISIEKYNKIPKEEKSRFPHICPDFVIEIMSPSDNLLSSEKKMHDWINNGCRLTWLICPDDEIVKIYSPNKPLSEIYGFDKTVSGEEVLPGFILDLSLIKK